MKKQIGLTLVFILTSVIGFSQEDKNKSLQIAIADSIINPVIMVLHSMGDINVKGHQGAELLVYAQELLPSVSELMKFNQAEVFSFVDQRTNFPVTVNRNNNFSVQQTGNLFQIETNLFSFNNHVFVMAPKRSSVAVQSRDFGNIVVENILGDVEAEGTAGNIYLKDIDGIINAATVTGNVIADLSSKEEDIPPLFISTFIGNIEIIAPENAKNTAILSSELGNLYSNFDSVNTINVSSNNQNSRSRLVTFDLNGGGTEFMLNTFKGDIFLRHQEKN